MDEVHRLSRQALVAGVSLDEWAGIAHMSARALRESCHPDMAVESAGRLARLLTSTPKPSRLAEAITHDTTGDASSIRRALLYATHAAAVRLPGGASRVLLMSLERTLLEDQVDTASPLDAALHSWQGIAIAHSRSGHIARTQTFLLCHTLQLLKQVGSEEDRLALKISSARDEWEALTRGSALQFEHPAVMMASHALHQSLVATSHSPSKVLHALLRSGLAGNLAISVAVNPPDQRLVMRARELEELTDQFAGGGFRFADPLRVMRQPPTSGTPVPRGIQVSSSLGQKSPSAQPLSGIPHSAGRIMFTPELEAELARRRDIGVLAKAALDGDSVAKGITAHLNDRDLRRLVLVGDRAIAELVGGAIPLIYFMLHKLRVKSHDLDEMFQLAALDVAKSVRRWDPHQVRWTTFASNQAKWAFYGAKKRDQGGKESARDISAESSHSWVAVGQPSVDPCEAVINEAQRREIRDVIAGLPAGCALVISDRWGFTDGVMHSLEETSRRRNLSTKQVRQRYSLGMDLLSARLSWRLAEPTATDATRPTRESLARRSGQQLSRQRSLQRESTPSPEW